MENTEYEYSFKVESLDKYIDYCLKNNYEKISENKETRTLYRNKNKTMARITKKNESKLLLDFKDDILTDDILIERRETLPLEFTNIEAIYSILNFLKYEKDTVLERTRIVYKKNNVIFELDKYESPEIMNVVAVEGKKEEVDLVYKEIIEKIKV